MKNIYFLNFFSFIFWIVEIDYFFYGLPIHERFQIWFCNEFLIIFYQKRVIFCQKLRITHPFYYWYSFFDSKFLRKGSMDLTSFLRSSLFVTKMKFYRGCSITLHPPAVWEHFVGRVELGGGKVIEQPR